MNEVHEQKMAANYMGAIAHLLGGKPGLHADFIRKVDVILSGTAPHVPLLMQFNDQVRQTGRPVLWIHHSEESPHVPQIGLVSSVGDQVYAIEACMLWMPRSESRARLIPDGFNMGAFRFDDDLRLRHSPKAPSRTFDRAKPSMIRAYARLREIEAAQLDRGEIFSLPPLAKAG